MKYLKRFNEQEKSIEDWCIELNLYDYTIEKGIVNFYYSNVNISKKNLERFPIEFGFIAGDFICSDNNLINLNGAPKRTLFSFECNNCNLETLEGCPEKVGSNFCCNNNNLTTLEGSPKSVGQDFRCRGNQLKSFIGCPKVGRDLHCQRNNLYKFDGLTSNSVHEDIFCEYNPIYFVYILFPNKESYFTSLDYNYFRVDNTIVRGRFEKACEDAEIQVPENIPGYRYI
jgi:hypothetical protein